MLHPQTSQMSQRCNLGWTNVTPLTNVATLMTPQTLRTTNVTKRRNMFSAHFQMLNAIPSHPL